MREKPTYEELEKRVQELEAAESEWKRTEAALRESQKKYQTLFEAANDAIFVAETETGILVDANREAEILLGKPKRDIIGKHQSFLHPPERESRAKEIFREHAAKKKEREFFVEEFVQHADGRQIPVEISPARIDIQGRPCLIGIFRDVSEQKKTKDILRQYESIVTAITDPVCYIDRNYVYNIVNDAYLRYFGKARAEMVGFPVWEVMGKESFETTRPHLDRCFSGKMVCYETWFSVPDGSRIFEEVCYYPVFDAAGETVVGAAFLSRDYTARKEAEKALKRSEERLRTVLESMGDAVLVHDFEGRFLMVNEAACCNTGYSREELLRKTVFDIVPENLPKKPISNFLEAFPCGEPIHFESEHRRSDGSVYPVEINLTRISMPEGPAILALARDITDRKKAENALRESRERFRLMTETIQDVFWVSTWGIGEIIYISPGFESIWEKDCASLYESPQNFLEKIHPKDMDLYLGEVERYHAKGIAYECEYRIVRDDGAVWWISERGFPVPKPFRGKHVMAGVCRDITDRKQAELALREREDRHRIISELSTDYFYRLKIEDSGSIFIDWVSDSFERVTTYGRSELNQFNTWLSKIHPDDRGKLAKNTEFLLANQPVWCHYRFTTRNGETRWLADRLHPEWSAAENRVVGAYGAVRDITERKKSEEALRESEARFRAIFEQAAAGIATATGEGIFLETNRTLCDMLGYTAEELCGLSVYDITFPDDREKQLDEDQPVREGKSDTVRMEKRFLHKAGHPVWANLASNVIRDQAGNIQYVIGVVVDIDQRKRMEEALLESLEEKEILLREIHHRVKNNMQAIVSLLRMHSRMGGDVPFKTIFEDCRGRIEAMALIHEALYQSDDLIRIDFQAYLRKLCRNLGRVHGAVEKGISVAVAPTRISLDMDQGIAVGMVIAELVSNAFKHAFPSGRIGNVTIGMETPEPGTVELRVADDGIGLPPDFDLENPQKLGLRLVSAAVLRELGGALEFNRNGGAAFVVRFPFANR